MTNPRVGALVHQSPAALARRAPDKADFLGIEPYLSHRRNHAATRVKLVAEFLATFAAAALNWLAVLLQRKAR
jgi:hypothetical protein